MKTTTRYLLVGIWNSVFGVGIFLILSLSLPELSDSLVLLISYIVSIVQAHFMQRKYVWSSTERYFQELVRFSGAYISQFVANLILLQIFVRFIGLNRSVSQVIIVLILTAVMFFVNKNGVFRAK